MRNAAVLIITDETEFARQLTTCWQAERKVPSFSVTSSNLYLQSANTSHDLVIVGPILGASLSDVIKTVTPSDALILCVPANAQELGKFRSRYPRLVHVPLREDWTQTLLLVAGESLRRAEALRLAQAADRHAAKNEHLATLGHYMIDMKHSVNNALTSMLGNAELLLLEPGQLSSQSLAQIKTIHSMALRINEIMQRFSSLAAEMREAEKASQAETSDTATADLRSR
ncbi:MAG: hypothetical protein NVS9B4_18230 [Candidatus Acidiferrum sp.]